MPVITHPPGCGIIAPSLQHSQQGMNKDSPIQFKGTTLKIIQAQLRTADTGALHTALAELTGNAPDFFENELAVLDFTGAADLPEAVDWPALCALLRQSGLQPVATRGLPTALAATAGVAGLPAVGPEALSNRPPRSRSEAAAVPAAAEMPAAPAPPPQPAQAAFVAPPPAPRTVTLDKPLRSGQRFYAQGSDLIVLAMVSAGAEVIADGNIHVYAPLRGRALAGASGDRSARIFTTSLEAELVSVAGIYRTFEAGVPAELARQPATVSLSAAAGEAEPRLNVAPLALR